MTPKSTACCGNGIMWEPLYYSPDSGPKVRFAVVRRCVKCHRLLGDCVLIKHDKALTPIQKKFSGTSWSMMFDAAVKRPGCPLNFTDGTVGLVPQGYQGDIKEQPDLTSPAPDETGSDQEVPF